MEGFAYGGNDNPDFAKLVKDRNPKLEHAFSGDSFSSSLPRRQFYKRQADHIFSSLTPKKKKLYL